MLFNYSIIIPHKDTPNLLQKCLDSIPKRDDVQVIVVDDNSDPNFVDFDRFPGLGRYNTEVYFTKEGKGSGYARNVGLKHAKGKWLVFADADDFFNSCINDALDLYKDTDYEIVLFKGTSINLHDNSIAYRCSGINERVDIALGTGCYDQILLYSSPCFKFINREFVMDKSITFQEVQWANDVLFMALISVNAKLYSASNLAIYCVTVSNNSLVANESLEAAVVRFNVECNATLVLKKKFKLELLSYWFIQTWINIYRVNKVKAFQRLPKAYSVIGYHLATAELLKELKKSTRRFMRVLNTQK